ncbi:hypothetical protein KAR91_30350 [Candidatus Pacearchaeota archaeon]|nr:hypothetical protein [Candidatus Pacearchaeota archaeon]
MEDICTFYDELQIYKVDGDIDINGFGFNEYFFEFDMFPIVVDEKFKKTILMPEVDIKLMIDKLNFSWWENGTIVKIKSKYLNGKAVICDSELIMTEVIKNPYLDKAYQDIIAKAAALKEET